MEENKTITDYSALKKEIVPVFPDAERVEILAALNKPLVVYDFKAMPSSLAEGKEYVVILAELNGKKVSFSCGEIVLKQLNDVKDKLPIRTTITKQKGKRYYTLG